MGVGKRQEKPATPRGIAMTSVSLVDLEPEVARQAKPTCGIDSKADSTQFRSLAGASHLKLVPRRTFTGRIGRMLPDQDKLKVIVLELAGSEECEGALHFSVESLCKTSFSKVSAKSLFSDLARRTRVSATY